ncbi:hypothetical protein FHG64_04805 [Antarcticibacterium flavum]|uniref:GNAT family N-acetyltransferase n=1 Tax=Antarcticibacterium flavum TaxID=2058175 RepID=A0A5B7X0B6_9FLAO|nr:MULTISPECIES: hypothetical protein [Antarcticibacterium]MCM4160755.1 hypothetical protein [Antarcticibacterium sp. W02-3]QCY68769.1 hypothetical protein FHG64_04805 [Antarcticibacterium flavum]
MKKEEVIEKVAILLKEIPTSMEIVKDDSKKDQRFHYLATHMVEKAIEKDALIISENQKGIAILFKTSKKDENFWQELPTQIGLLKNVTGFKNAMKILKSQSYIKNQRPKEGEYLYCWFWGILADARGADTQTGKEMKDEFYRRAEKFKLPLYAETRMRQNAIVYQRFGFELFHKWNHPSGDTMYFLRYIPKSLKEQSS